MASSGAAGAPTSPTRSRSAQILADLGMTAPTLCAALLHDTVEDTDYSWNELRETSVTRSPLLVDGVTKLDKVKYGQAAQAETIRKMVVAMARDIRVLVIKLCDRLHNMRTLRYLPAAKQEQKARETLEIYAPLAHRLGMNAIKWELEDLSFATLYPKMFVEIVELVDHRAPQSRAVPRRGHRARSRESLHAGGHRGRGHRATQALLQRVPEDDRPRSRLHRHLRPGRDSHSRRLCT